eukprot:5231120-Prorocentrum_lima.AAC.1
MDGGRNKMDGGAKASRCKLARGANLLEARWTEAETRGMEGKRRADLRAHLLPMFASIPLVSPSIHLACTLMLPPSLL